ncbi:TetR/AcrR family transcriptional regulator [Mesorhizobium sp. VNQ89]|uniref:TetR/AcrR family transcriptional regulator n=1 Tax=Mesorhizobium quangtriensis TaxID=3157709 RepID=UPI0032B756D6
MSPRQYVMNKREASVARTRQRIVEATLELHGRKGIFGTSWQDIAAAADVSIGTVYKHFPSLDELVPACGELLMERIFPPSPEDLPAILGDALDPRERLRRVVRELFSFFERGGKYLESDPRERELESMRDFEDQLRSMVSLFVGEALRTMEPSEADLAVVSALADLPSFQAMAIRGVPLEDAVAVAVGGSMGWLQKAADEDDVKQGRKS